MKPWMSEAEISMLDRYLFAGRTGRVLEWGSGGSTLHLARHAERLISVEHDGAWQSRVSAALVANGCPLAAVLHVPADVPNPVRPSRCDDWATYVAAGPMASRKFGPFHLVLVDGRARPQCAAAIASHLMPNAVLLVHDYFAAGREYYSAIEQHYELIDSVHDGQTMAVFRARLQA